MWNTETYQRLLTGSFVLLFLTFQAAYSQTFKFPVTSEGVYRITATQAQQLGAGSVDELQVLGHHGSLPQKLDSASLELKELPVKKIGNDLFFYASGPHFHSLDLDYHHHPYTDTLFYLVKTGQTGQKQITTKSAESIPEPGQGVLYQLHTHKDEFFNLLNSGRMWWGDRHLNGQLQNFFFPPHKISQPVFYQFHLLGQSQGENSFAFKLNDQTVADVPIDAIPTSTYGIKGRTAKREGFFELPSSTGIKASFQYQSSNPNGTGYLGHLTIGIPHLLEDAPHGIHHYLSEEILSIPAGQMNYLAIGDGSIEVLSPGAHYLGKSKIGVFDPAHTPTVSALTPVNLNLDLSGSEMIIIAPAALISQAQRLAGHRSNKGISTSVAEIQGIYDAFGYGNRDVSAIRNFIAAQYHQGGKLRNVLFFGKGTFDYKSLMGGRPNLVPIYTSRESLNPLTTYSSDDFYGFLDWGAGEWEETGTGNHLLNIGVGRLPAINVQEAVAMVDKLIAYDQPANVTGDWKRRILLFADDGDNHLHLNDAERHAAFLYEHHPELEVEKLYLDSFGKVNQGGSSRSPQAAEALLKKVRDGVLLINYVGHGNENVLTAEQVFNVSQLENWPEHHRLPVLVTATCEFGRQDSPLLRSGAEEMLTRRRKGAIALLTTGRPVFSSANYAINRAFMENAFQRNFGEALSLGEIYRLTKNQGANGLHNRSFSLLGDPSMKMAIPPLGTDIENFQVAEVEIDTLKGLQATKISGKITDPLTGSLQTGFSGNYLMSITDKPQKVQTLGNVDPKTYYLNENTVVFRGSGNIENGAFAAEFMIPELSGEVDWGTVKIYAEDENGIAALGANRIALGGKAENLQDTKGPSIRMLVNDPKKHSPTVASTQVPLFIFLEDESGINISPSHPDHHPLLSINENAPYSLASAYQALDNGFTKGAIVTILSDLREGKNKLTFQVYDKAGNRSEKSIEVTVEGINQLRILSQSVYPNPASTSSRFRWSHNRPGEDIQMDLRIFSLSGSEIFSHSQRYPHAEAQLDDLEWIFLQSKTKYPVKGTYIYKLELRSEADGTSDSKSGKLIIQ
jgi:hypothetical protein